MRAKAVTVLSWVLPTVLLLLPTRVVCQGVFVYDQQSADESSGGGAAVTIQSNQPLGQSFIPSLSAIGFIRLQLGDRNAGDGLGASVFVNLRTNSITGSVLAHTDPVFMPDGFGVGNGNRGYTNFLFSTPFDLATGATYFFEVVTQPGPSWAVVGYNYGYSGGTAFLSGQADPLNDLWFREGVIVPEPSTACLALLGSVLLIHARKKFIQS
jgi:hypothetical protein